MHSRLLIAAALSAVAAMALLTSSAAAITQIDHVRVAADETGTGGSDDFHAQGSPESVWVLYDYSDASPDTRYDEVAERQAALAGLAEDATELESLAEQIAGTLGDLSGLRLPAMGPRWAFDVMVRVSEGNVRDMPAGDAWFYVGRGAGRIFLPYGASGHTHGDGHGVARRHLPGDR